MWIWCEQIPSLRQQKEQINRTALRVWPEQWRGMSVFGMYRMWCILTISSLTYFYFTAIRPHLQLTDRKSFIQAICPPTEHCTEVCRRETVCLTVRGSSSAVVTWLTAFWIKLSEQAQENELGGPSGSHGRGEESVQGFGGKALRKETTCKTKM
jgi:hypothetical protein